MVKSIYAIFRFSFEILCIVIIGYWGFSLMDYGRWRILLGVLVPGIIMIIWGIWGAPTAPKRLEGVFRLGLELSVCVISAVCLYSINFKEFTPLFLVIAIVNAGINYFTNWLI